MSEEKQRSKRHERSIADDLICPITLELPFNPVMAEDGRIYERAAIEKHFESSEGEITSPITQQAIGRKLFPAHQYKNHIEFLVEKGLISGDLAGKWNEKVKEKKDAEELLQKAQSGEVEAMELVGYNHIFGEMGFSEDHKKSYLWYDRAREAGSVKGMTRVGEALALGSGVEEDCVKGFMYLGIAAAQGSDVAAIVLGKVFAFGWCGAKVDKSLAVHWLEKVTSGECTVKDLNPGGSSLVEAQELLDNLKKSQEG